MTKTQKKKTIAIIKTDATARVYYCTNQGQTCVIGALLKKAGWSHKLLRSLKSMAISNSFREMVRARETLLSVYGIPLPLAETLQFINDSHRLLSERRKLLMRAVKNVKS